MSNRVLSLVTQRAVEQALAMGRSTEWITTRLPVTVGEVERVRQYLETVNSTPERVDLQAPKPGGAA